MKLLKSIFFLVLGATVCTLALAPRVMAQGVDAAMLLNPPADSWPTYNGEYSGQRHSKLTQITPQNVKNLSLAWAFQTNQTASIKSTPLLVDGILYFTVPDNVWAVDARSGHLIWHYHYPPNKGDHIGNRGVAMYKNWIYFMGPDAHMVSLNAKDGTVRWNIVVADSSKGYWTTEAPLVVGDHVIAGVGGDLDNLPMFVQSFDPETGALQWRWDVDSAPGLHKPITGGTTWMPGTYDPKLNLVYWGTGNPHPVLAGIGRAGDNLYTCTILAINPDTGAIVWAFQASPHDTHDWDAVETPVLFDAEFNGKPRKLLAQASRNGYFFVLDRQTGENLLTSPFIKTDWVARIDKAGRPVPDPAKYPQLDGSLLQGSSNGGTNWMSPSFDPETKLFYVNAQEGYSFWYLALDAENLPADHQGGGSVSLVTTSVLKALDYQTGKVRWSRESGNGISASGILTTAGHVLFTGDLWGNLLALDPADGHVLWHARPGGVLNSAPITYQLDGHQYVLTGVDSVMYAWELPTD